VFCTETLGTRLRSAREKKGYKQIQVKDKTGINNKTLSGYENGVSEPDWETLVRLADLYEVTTDYLLGKNNKGTTYAIPENDFEGFVKEMETKYKVNLRDDPIVRASFRQLVESIAQTKLAQQNPDNQ